ncbi:MAG: hypothetical protein IJH34_05785 [Romboutsia sp.]|nr:hypothetical protein [Romboutsia sp.]
MAKLRNLTDLQKLSLDIAKGKVEKYSMTEGSDVIREAILDACGMENGWDVYKFQQNKYEVYRILSETITVAISELMIDKYRDWVDFKDTALGDIAEFRVTNNDLFKVGLVADGTNELRRQKLLQGRLAMTGFPMGVKIYAEFLDFMMGKIDWQDLVNRVAKSMDNKVAELIVKQIESAYNGLDTKYVQSGSYDEEKLMDLVARVEAKTGEKVAIFGTKKALAKLRKGEIATMAVADKDDIRNHGYVTVLQGTPVVEIPQTLDQKGDFALSADMLFIVPQGTKMIKLGFEGDAYISEVNDPATRMDQQMEYLITRKVQIGCVKASYYGVYHSIV